MQITNLYGATNDEYSQPRHCWDPSGKYIYGASIDRFAGFQQYNSIKKFVYRFWMSIYTVHSGVFKSCCSTVSQYTSDCQPLIHGNKIISFLLDFSRSEHLCVGDQKSDNCGSIRRPHRSCGKCKMLPWHVPFQKDHHSVGGWVLDQSTLGNSMHNHFRHYFQLRQDVQTIINFRFTENIFLRIQAPARRYGLSYIHITMSQWSVAVSTCS